jgi:hypothetical protein
VDPDLDPLETVLGESDLLIIAAPHAMYRELEADVPIVDIWDLQSHGDRI